jgi:hypothetical protein
MALCARVAIGRFESASGAGYLVRQAIRAEWALHTAACVSDETPAYKRPLCKACELLRTGE